MRRFGLWLGRLVLIVPAFSLAVWLVAPREPVDGEIDFDRASIGPDLDAYLAAREARFDDIVPGVEKRVVWAGPRGDPTGWSVLYLHGFSATSEEIRPVPDRVARALAANLVFTRLTGHGRSGTALAEATAGDWLEDTAEALAIARAAGDRVLVIATSTGGTLAALAALDPELSKNLSGLVLVSPNFGLRAPAGRLLTWPAARYWVPLVAGQERRFTTINEDHARYWTEAYPTTSILPVAALVKHATAQDFGAATIPAMFLFSDADAVVDPADTREVIATWGGPVTIAPQVLPPGNDPYNHVLAGDILSPGMTAPVTAQIVEWARGLRK